MSHKVSREGSLRLMQNYREKLVTQLTEVDRIIHFLQQDPTPLYEFSFRPLREPTEPEPVITKKQDVIVRREKQNQYVVQAITIIRATLPRKGDRVAVGDILARGFKTSREAKKAAQDRGYRLRSLTYFNYLQRPDDEQA